MNGLTNILIGLLIFSGTSALGQLGKAIITYQPVYEDDNNYFPHDYFIEFDLDGILDKAASIKTKNHKLFITNRFNNGFTGHEVQFIISPDLEIIKAQYYEWNDVIDGSESRYLVDKVILSFSDNPFEEKLITAHYTLQIKEEYYAGKTLSQVGAQDTVTSKIFNGKFKFYSEEEKRKGRKWILDQNEIRMGIKDSLGIYELPDNHAKFVFGEDSLKEILSAYDIDRAKAEVPLKGFITLQLIIDENGKVDLTNIKIWEPIKSFEIIEHIKQDSALRSNWLPATIGGRPVKSKVNLPIRIK